jgi:hypothetical protein
MRYAGPGLAIVGAVAAAACDKTEPDSAYESANLELAEVVSSEQFEEARIDLTGDISAEGADRDWTVSVGPRSFTLHSSGASDLSVIGALPGGRASLARDSFTEELSVELLDAEGNLHYLLEAVEPGPLTFENFGSGFVAAASDLGVAQQGNFEVTFVSAWMRTDTGDVELLPGEPQEVTIDGASWRAVLLAGFTTELKIDGAVLCDGADSRLAFELLRLDAPGADLAALTREEGRDLPVGSCNSAPVLPE